MLLCCFILSTVLLPGEDKLLTLDNPRASKFAAMAMKCIEKEYPNKLSHVMNDAKEVLNPKTLHPTFYGCFDWHSSVHGHWMLIRLLKLFPNLPQSKEIRNALNRNITTENIKQEVAYLHQKSRKSFERTYGWAWLLKLVEELYNWNDKDGKKWLKNLAPLEEEIIKRYIEFLPKQTYAIRTGVHPNTAFGIAFALDYARTAKNKPLEELLIERSYYYYHKNTNYPANWEPGGEDFFSPSLMAASLMQRVLKPQDFAQWFHAYLPQTKEGKPWSLMEPAIVTDRSDGKLVHLDGLNLSRAWCMKRIANGLPKNDKARNALLKSAHNHTTDALKNIHSGDYAGEHWLASFAVYLLTH
ncbi:MAG: DUF2891 domain-containing protein [bacterium]|nr:DUF2891 domain-containing protein [bacterium]